MLVIPNEHKDMAITSSKPLKPYLSGKNSFCMDGKRACPPEDCGGPWGYKRYLSVLKSKKALNIEMQLK